MKKVCILKGSPRAGGNTNALLKPFAEELKEKVQLSIALKMAHMGRW